MLYHNMKHGVVASKELAEFLRERSAIEENNYKLLSKVAKQASNSTQGSFAPVWAALRGAAEKLADLHLQMAQRVTELIKDVSKYADELHKKHKAVRTSTSLCLPWYYGGSLFVRLINLPYFSSSARLHGFKASKLHTRRYLVAHDHCASL